MGLNRRSYALPAGGRGGLVLTQHLITWYGNGRSTRHLLWVIRPTWRTAKNFQHIHMTAVHQNTLCIIIILTGEDDNRQIDSRRYSFSHTRICVSSNSHCYFSLTLISLLLLFTSRSVFFYDHIAVRFMLTLVSLSGSLLFPLMHSHTHITVPQIQFL
jgi:hypothetical protein